MKVTVDSKKGLKTNLKVFVEKKTIEEKIGIRLTELSKTVSIKGFRPGKVPTEVLKRQFGKAVYGEVIDKVLKETSTKALQDNKIKPAGQPKIDLKTFGEGKDLEYIISVTELPKIETKSFSELWNDLWGGRIALQYRSEENISKEKFNKLKEGITLKSQKKYNLKQLIENSKTRWNTPEWGFPKGRRNYQENDIHCAIREFEEETGLRKQDLKIIRSISL